MKEKITRKKFNDKLKQNAKELKKIYIEQNVCGGDERKIDEMVKKMIEKVIKPGLENKFKITDQ